MAAGELNVRGGAAKLLEGNFEFNVPSWEPQVHSSNNGTHTDIEIRQPNNAHLGGNRHYAWDLQLNNDVLLDLGIHCGAGQAKLNLGELDLRRVEVHMGAGQVDLDLRGSQPAIMTSRFQAASGRRTFTCRKTWASGRRRTAALAASR